MPDDRRLEEAIRRTAWFALVLAGAFWLWFQLTKLPWIAAADPFADDPYDAVGSIAVQAAAGLAILSLARASRPPRRSAAAWRRRDDDQFVLRGVLLVVAGVIATLATDTLAVAEQPGLLATSPVASAFLVGGLVALGAGAIATAVALTRAWRRLDRCYAGLPTHSSYRRGMLAEAALDVARLAWWPVAWASRHVASLDRLVKRATQFIAHSRAARSATRLVVRALDHPWWTLITVAAGLGAAFVAAEMVQEGPPADAGTAVLVLTVFVTIEVVAVLAGFLLFGAYLGLRPPIRRPR